MSTTNIGQSLNKIDATGVRTLWDQRLLIPPRFAVGIAALVLVIAYLPNLRALMTIWHDDPSYNHGFLVIPIALFILWQQISSSEPKTVPKMVLAPWWGWVFLVVVLLVRAVAYERGSDWLENATIIPAIAAWHGRSAVGRCCAASGRRLSSSCSCFLCRRESTVSLRCRCNRLRHRVVTSCCNSQEFG